MKDIFQRCGGHVVLLNALAAFAIATVSAGPVLGTNGSTFAILGGAGVAVNGTGSTIDGSVGGCCNATSVTGFPAAFTDAGGTVFNSGTLPTGTETAAQAELGNAINALTALGPGISESTLNGIMLPPGVYSIAALT